jgi:hypothetical protein
MAGFDFRRWDIESPQGRAFNGGLVNMDFHFESAFQAKWTRVYSKTQAFVDSEVLRLCEPFTPLKTGELIRSGKRATKIGSGVVTWNAPYSAYQYYMYRVKPSPTGILRNNFWFQRMKEVHGKTILSNAKKVFRKESRYGS